MEAYTWLFKPLWQHIHNKKAPALYTRYLVASVAAAGLIISHEYIGLFSDNIYVSGQHNVHYIRC
jgi:hypothetical protein